MADPPESTQGAVPVARGPAEGSAAVAAAEFALRELTVGFAFDRWVELQPSATSEADGRASVIAVLGAVYLLRQDAAKMEEIAKPRQRMKPPKAGRFEAKSIKKASRSRSW